MTVTIQLSPDIEAFLLAQAQAHELSSEQRLQNFQAWLKSHANSIVVLPDEATERESIYGGHGR